MKKLAITALLSLSVKLISTCNPTMPPCEMNDCRVVCCEENRDDKREPVCQTRRSMANPDTDDSIESRWDRIKELLKRSEEKTETLKQNEKVLAEKSAELSELEKALLSDKMQSHSDYADVKKTIKEAKKAHSKALQLIARITRILQKSNVQTNIDKLNNLLGKLETMSLEATKKTQSMSDSLEDNSAKTTEADEKSETKDMSPEIKDMPNEAKDADVTDTNTSSSDKTGATDSAEQA